MSDDEIDPYVIYRVNGDRLECALWNLDGGGKALALFLTPESATAYLASAALDNAWKTFRPTKPDLWQIFDHSVRAGIRYAVLDPDNVQARRLFDLALVMSASPPATEN